MKFKSIFFIAFLLLGLTPIRAQKVYKLYDGPAPGTENWKHTEYQKTFPEFIAVCNVVEPTLTAYFPEKEKANGTAMVICPGGGFQYLGWDYEGTNFAEWLNGQGITAFILKYRLRYTGDYNPATGKGGYRGFNFSGTPPVPTEEEKAEDAKIEKVNKTLGNVQQMGFDDGRKAIEYVRSHASEWDINPNKIAMSGFSAGGMVALNVAMNHTEESKPDLLCIIYSGTTDITVPEDAAPAFWCAPQNDVFTSDMSYNVHKAWTGAGKISELHYFIGTHHGFGFRDGKESVYIWPQLFLNFMKTSGFLE